MKCLFLGGSADGQRIEVSNALPEIWMVPVSRPVSSAVIQDIDVTKFAKIETNAYHRVRFTDRDGTELAVYWYEDDNLKPLSRLIAGYKKSTP